jgi:phage portal protein BeeE
VVFNKLWEDRAVSFQTIFESGDDIVFGTNAGTYVDESNALNIAAVHSAVSLIADTISTLPVDVFTSGMMATVDLSDRNLCGCLSLM